MPEKIKTETRAGNVLLTEYRNYLAAGSYQAMYGMLDSQSQMIISQKDFVTRNQNIYEGIKASNIQIELKETELKEYGAVAVACQTAIDSLAGEISFLIRRTS